MTQIEKRRKDDAAFISNPERWPAYPYLPIKRYPKEHNGPECAILLSGSAPWKKVYLKSVWDLPIETDELVVSLKYRYETVEDLLADGWMVD